MTSYLRHWNLEFSPYRQPVEIYPSPTHSEALARIDYLASERRTLGAVLGATGMGKSTLLEATPPGLVRGGRRVAEVDAFAISSRELLWQIASGLDAQPTLGDGVSRLWQRLADLAAEHAWQQQSAVVLVDDAGQAGADACQHLVRLTRVAEQAGAAWTFILAATPNEANRWPDPLREIVDLRIELYAWDDETTVDYLQHALLAAGRLEPVFTEDALRLIHSLSAGLPRAVSRLADFSLVVGAGAAVAIVDTGIVESAHGQVAWPTAVAG